MQVKTANIARDRQNSAAEARAAADRAEMYACARAHVYVRACVRACVRVCVCLCVDR